MSLSTGSTPSTQSLLEEWYESYLETVHFCRYTAWEHELICRPPLGPLLTFSNVQGEVKDHDRLA